MTTEEILRTCLDRMVALCITEIKQSGLSPISFFGSRHADRMQQGDDLEVVCSYLRLDPDVLSDLSTDHRTALLRIASETESALRGVLDEVEQRRFDEGGLPKLLETVDYPALAEVFCRMNGLPPPGRNTGDYRDLFCSRPFEYAEIGPGGRTFLCCPLQVPTDVGNAKDGTFMEVWNSQRAQAIRGSILDGSFSHCIEKTCPFLQAGTLPKREDVTDSFFRQVIDEKLTVLDRGPSTVFMNYDRSCNLACPTCRSGLVVLTGKARREVEWVQDWATSDHLKDARRLHVTGSGDAFGSQVFHSFLRRFDPRERPELRVSVGTNGLLFTPQTWAKICREAIDIVVVSVDAASSETYTTNRGGEFATLVENLHFIGSLRTSGQIKVFGINFVVQANNFEEMPAFVELGRTVHVDSVCFQQITNWGTFSNAEFEARAVHHPAHPRYIEFIGVLSAPALGDPLVDLSNLRALRTATLGLESETLHLAE